MWILTIYRERQPDGTYTNTKQELSRSFSEAITKIEKLFTNVSIIVRNTGDTLEDVDFTLIKYDEPIGELEYL